MSSLHTRCVSKLRTLQASHPSAGGRPRCLDGGPMETPVLGGSGRFFSPGPGFSPLLLVAHSGGLRVYATTPTLAPIWWWDSPTPLTEATPLHLKAEHAHGPVVALRVAGAPCKVELFSVRLERCVLG